MVCKRVSQAALMAAWGHQRDQAIRKCTACLTVRLTSASPVPSQPHDNQIVQAVQTSVVKALPGLKPGADKSVPMVPWF